jgi:predicted transposase YbfD/YdcC
MESSILLSGVEVPLEEMEIEAGSLYERLSQLTDRRGRRGRRYWLALILTLVLLAKLAGETTASGIAHWARLRQSWLQERLHLRRSSLPCANTYPWVCNQVDVTELNTVLAAYFVPPLPLLTEGQAVASLTEAARAVRHLALDGKTLRGSDQQGVAACPAVQVVTLFDVTNQGPLDQQARQPGQDERDLAQQMLAGKDLRGCLITADALHTQRTWAHQVRQQGGDYLLLVKGNQALVQSELTEFFAAALPRWLEERRTRQSGKAHGRLEIRTLRASTEMCDLLAPTWSDVAQVFQIERTITRQGATSHETVYGLTSVPPTVADAQRLLHFSPQHWFIENNVHWRRDVTLGEDRCLVRSPTAALILAILNTAVLALCDHLGVSNVAAQMREFMAFPASALALLLTKPDF